jgi:hypothetical protein
MDLRTALAAALGVALGLALVAYPDAVVRAHSVGRVPGDRRGEYGSDGDAPDRSRRVVQALGLGSVVLGLYFASQVV